MHFSSKKRNSPILFQPFCCSKQIKLHCSDPYLGIFSRRIDLEHFQDAKMVMKLYVALMGATRGAAWGPHFGAPEIKVLLPPWVSAVWFLITRNRLKPLSTLSDHHAS